MVRGCILGFEEDLRWVLEGLLEVDGRKKFGGDEILGVCLDVLGLWRSHSHNTQFVHNRFGFDLRRSSGCPQGLN